MMKTTENTMVQSQFTQLMLLHLWVGLFYGSLLGWWYARKLDEMGLPNFLFAWFAATMALCSLLSWFT
jgi:hypothetical protein